MQLRLTARTIALLLLLPLAAARGQTTTHEDRPPTPPASGPTTQSEGTAKLQELLDAGGLELSDQPTSARQDFSYRIVLAFPSATGGPHPIVVFGTHKDGKTAQMAWAYDAHLPLVYSSSDLLVCLDREKPGTLLVGEPRGQPYCVVGPNPERPDDFFFGSNFGGSAEPDKGLTHLSLDFAWLFKGMQKKLRTATFDPKTNTLLCVTEHTVARLVLRDAKDKGFPLKAFCLGERQDSPMLAIFVDEKPAVDLFSLDRKALAKLGVPIAEFRDRNFLAGFNVLPVMPVADSPERLKVAEKLGVLLSVEKTASDEIMDLLNTMRNAAKTKAAETAPK